LEAFKEKALGYIKAVQAGELGTLTYQWTLEEDGKSIITPVADVASISPECLAETALHQHRSSMFGAGL